MAATIEYFFTPISGFAYLGHAALYALARDHGANIVLRPMDSLAVFAAIDVTPPPKQPAARLRYRQSDMQRWAACRRLPLVVEPRHWPTDASLAARAIVAVDRRDGAEAGGVLACGLLAAVWAQDLDIADPAVVAGVARACGLDGERVLDEAHAASSLDAYRGHTAAAIARGVLGSPTFFVGEAMFFGQDRLSFVGQALAEAPTC